MRFIFLLFSFLLCFFDFSVYALNCTQTDTLLIPGEIVSDSVRISELLSASWDCRNTEPEKAVLYGKKAIELAETGNDFEQLAKAYSFVGVAYRVMGKYSESLDCYYKGLEIAEKNNVAEQAGYARLNLANLYIYQEHSSLAFENIRMAEAIANKIGNKQMLAYVYLFFGRSYKLDTNLDSALFYYRRSVLIRHDLGQEPEEATCYKYIGDIYFEKGALDSALANYNISLRKVNVQADKDLYANILIQKASVSVRENRLEEAIPMAMESLSVASEIGANMAVRDALRVLAEISLRTHNYKSAAEYYEKIIMYNDTLFNQSLSEKIFSIEYQLVRQRQEAEISLLNKDNEIKALKIKRIKAISIALTSILASLVFLSVILLRLVRQRRDRAVLLEKQNQEILVQRNSIELQNKMLLEANEKLASSEEDMRHMVQTKDKLFSIIAHDLRNPFMALSGLTEILSKNASGTDPEEIAEYASMINESSHKLLALIENLLQWANSQTGRLTLAPVQINLRELTSEVFRALAGQAEAKKIDLINIIPDNIVAIADRETTSVIVRNLVSNGIKYTQQGGSVIVNAISSATMIELSVKDTGIGMDSESIDKLFRIDISFTTAGTGHESGTGLGLIICKEFSEKNGGGISVESEKGKGTTFTLTLPSV